MLGSQPLFQDPQARVELLALERVADKAVVARMRVVNQSAQPLDFGSMLSAEAGDGRDVGTFDSNAVSGIALFDGGASQLHYPLVSSAKECLCTRANFPKVAAGASWDIAAAFPPPKPGVGKMTVLFPGAAPFFDVAVGTRADGTVPVDDSGKTVDAATTETRPPRVIPVIATTQNDTGAEDDSGQDLRVRISSDVLFALNKADLSPRAQTILADVAKKIDASTGTTVKIDGHTDNSGNDAINQPLSERRAQSVEAKLKTLVTRPGVGYESKGHGSTEPLVPNDSAEGRAKNRRVSVTFTRPKPAPQPAATGAGRPAGPQASGTIAGSPLPPGWTGAWPKKAKVTVDRLQRAADGYTALTMTVHNDDPAVLNVNSLFTAPPGDGYKWESLSGVVLSAGGKRYRVLKDDRGVAVAPRMAALDTRLKEVGQGEQLTLTALYKLPPEVSAVSVEVPYFAKIDGIAVG
ncbi:OmpA family protein [Actinomadura macrotermitis]|uniref:OmpA family protein n=1 Tax=Actinomadura macrotermitis TaxID=2585200 RepID=UPI002E25C03E